VVDLGRFGVVYRFTCILAICLARLAGACRGKESFCRRRQAHRGFSRSRLIASQVHSAEAKATARITLLGCPQPFKSRKRHREILTALDSRVILKIRLSRGHRCNDIQTASRANLGTILAVRIAQNSVRKRLQRVADMVGILEKGI